MKKKEVTPQADAMYATVCCVVVRHEGQQSLHRHSIYKSLQTITMHDCVYPDQVAKQPKKVAKLAGAPAKECTGAAVSMRSRTFENPIFPSVLDLPMYCRHLLGQNNT